MSIVARSRLALGLASAAVLGGMVVYFATSGAVPGVTEADRGAGGAVLADSALPFTITGNATTPISPGVMAPLDLSLTNPHEVPMSVTALTVSVQEVRTPNADDAHPCTLNDFTVDQASRLIRITVAPHATSALSRLGFAPATWPAVGMLERSVNQDGCKGASLTLGYAASGTLTQ